MEVKSLAQSVNTPNYQNYAADTTSAKSTEGAQSPAADTLRQTQSPAPQQAPVSTDVKAHDVKRTQPDSVLTEPDVLKDAYHSAENNLLQKAVEMANRKLIGDSRMLEYSVHEETHRIMIKVIDTDTDKVIREIPPEHTLDQFAKVLELAGLMVDKKR